MGCASSRSFCFYSSVRVVPINDYPRYTDGDERVVQEEDYVYDTTSTRERLEVAQLLQDLTEGRVTPPPPYSKEAMPGHVSLLRSPSLVKTNDELSSLDFTAPSTNNTTLDVSCGSQSFHEALQDTSALDLADDCDGADCRLRSSYDAPTNQGGNFYGQELDLIFPPRSQCNNNSTEISHELYTSFRADEYYGRFPQVHCFHPLTPSAHLLPPPPPLRPLTILQPPAPAPRPNALPPILPSNSHTAQELSHHLKRRRKRRTRSCPATPI